MNGAITKPIGWPKNKMNARVIVPIKEMGIKPKTLTSRLVNQN